MKRKFTLVSGTLFCVLSFLFSSAQTMIHPGISHKRSDLDRMKYMVQAGIEPWKTSFANLSANAYASYNYTVQGSSTNTVIDATISSEYNKIKYDGLAAYYNSLMWYITGDQRHAQKAVEIFNAWSNVRRFVSGGTQALDAGRVVWKLLEAAEIIKSTYTGWAATDIDRFKAMLVYPGYSTTTEPTAAINSQDVTFYWYMYNGDPGRHGNQGLFAMRGIMAMGIFLDNRVMYERALKYLKGEAHRTDDLAYPTGPPIVSSSPDATKSNEYYDEYNPIAPYRDTTVQDYGYNERIEHYIWENGQCQEASRDQAHTILGVGILASVAEMAWSQGDDLFSLLNNRILKGAEYGLKYNISYKYAYPDQSVPWEPTVASGEFLERRDRSGRWYSKKINPYNANDLTRITRGEDMLSNRRPIHEQLMAHYQGRAGLSDSDVMWTMRGRDKSIELYGYEKGGFEVDHAGWGGLAYRRPSLSPGDPCYFSDGKPVFRMNILPGSVEAEDFDYFPGNALNKTYNDLTLTNVGAQYRTSEAVDIETCSEGGFNVTSMEPGEWLDYTVNVPATGNYNIVIRYASANANGKIRFDFDGVNKTGDVAVPFGGAASGGLQDWKDFTVANNVSLSAGVQSMRIYIGGTQVAFNLNKITLIDASTVSPPAAPTNLAAKAGNEDVALSWSASSGASSYNIKRSTTAGGPYITIVTGLTTTSYTNTGLINGTSYYYVVSAVNSNGEGANSGEVSATPLSTLLPNPWVNADIGTATGGSASYQTGTFTVKGAGTDIGSTSDNFNYLYQTISGDVTFIARYASRVIGGNVNDKVGIMIRESATANSPHVSILIDAGTVNTVANRARLCYRSTSGGASTYSDGPGQVIPVWLKLERVGNVFKAYASADGVSYTQVGASVTVSMASSVQLGAAICSRDAASLNTSTFDNMSIIQPSSIPSAPTGLTATAGDSKVDLSWTASSNTTSYNVKRSTTTGGPYTAIATGITTTAYSNTGLTNGTTYYYVVSAVNSAGESANSSQVSATPQVAAPATPTGLTATAGDSKVDLSWTASSNATSYNVKRSTTPGGTYTTIATGVTATSYSNTGLTNGTAYYYVVSGVNSGGESANSNEVSATPSGSSISTILVENATGGNKLQVKRKSTGAQSFVYGNTGGANYYIKKIVLYLSTDATLPNANFNVNIGTGRNSGVITGTSVSISPSAITNNTAGSSFMAYTITYSSAVGPLTAGTTYFINMSCEATNGSAIYAEISPSDVYSGGTCYQGTLKLLKDLRFQLWGGGSSAIMSTGTEDILVADLVNGNSAAKSSVFPNPVSGNTLSINYPDEAAGKETAVSLFDSSGRRVLIAHLNVSSTGVIEVPIPSSLNSGLFSVLVNGRFLAKVLLRR